MNLKVFALVLEHSKSLGRPPRGRVIRAGGLSLRQGVLFLAIREGMEVHAYGGIRQDACFTPRPHRLYDAVHQEM